MKNNSSFLVWFIHASPFILKTILLGLLGISLYASYTLLTSDPPGYCGEQKRFLTDEEFIEAAVHYEYPTGRMTIDGSEESLRTFYYKNPKCCHVDRKDKRSLFDKMIGGRYHVEVSLFYETNDAWRKRTRTIDRYYGNYLAIDTCGEVRETYYGMERGEEEISRILYNN